MMAHLQLVVAPQQTSCHTGKVRGDAQARDGLRDTRRVARDGERLTTDDDDRPRRLG